jgi:hypothetical protein
VAWVTGGLEDRVVRNEEPGLVWALVTGDGAFLITTNIEQPRLVTEENLSGFDLAGRIAAALEERRGLSPIIGFAVGVLVLMTALTSNIGNITLIGSTVLSLIAPGETNNKPLTWVVATVVCALVVAIAVIGVKVTIRFEGWVILVEYMIIASLAIWGAGDGAHVARRRRDGTFVVLVYAVALPRRVDRADRGGGDRDVPARRLGLAHLPGR